jgi:hypothetical protein
MEDLMFSPFAERLRDYLRAGYPALAVATHEEERLLGDLRTLRAAGWGVVAWSMARGWVDADGKVLNRGQGDPVRAVQALMTLPEKTVAVFFDLHPYLAQFRELVRSVRDALPAAKATQRPLLLCSPETTLPVEWEKDVAWLDYPLPAREALQGLLDELVGPAKITLPPAVRDASILVSPAGSSRESACTVSKPRSANSEVASSTAAPRLAGPWRAGVRNSSKISEDPRPSPLRMPPSSTHPADEAATRYHRQMAPGSAVVDQQEKANAAPCGAPAAAASRQPNTVPARPRATTPSPARS